MYLSFPKETIYTAPLQSLKCNIEGKVSWDQHNCGAAAEGWRSRRRGQHWRPFAIVRPSNHQGVAPNLHSCNCPTQVRPPWFTLSPSPSPRSSPRSSPSPSSRSPPRYHLWHLLLDIAGAGDFAENALRSTTKLEERHKVVIVHPTPCDLAEFPDKNRLMENLLFCDRIGKFASCGRPTSGLASDQRVGLLTGQGQSQPIYKFRDLQ